MTKTMNYKIKNRNENLKKKNWTVSKNIEIPYNKANNEPHTSNTSYKSCLLSANLEVYSIYGAPPNH